jgi:cellulose synthase/poly-beta-1,6-N-acetylglucosamine synthase-like glycosyltransferase
MNKISVIVPIYNTEKYLRKYVDSIITQTYRNPKNILIDNTGISKLLFQLRYKIKFIKENIHNRLINFLKTRLTASWQKMIHKRSNLEN